jgi:uncharacterized protein YndB with AHSA1/START domain
MTIPVFSSNDPRELGIVRLLGAPRMVVWRCWVESALLKQWYCPKPWFVSSADLDVRPGGKSHIVMNGPNGEESAYPGQYLEVVSGQRLVFSDAYVGDWKLGPKAALMTGVVELSDHADGGTLMTWSARHWDDAAVAQHKAMGFELGWSAAAAQLDALARSL